jgi:hypothetical protein
MEPAGRRNARPEGARRRPRITPSERAFARSARFIRATGLGECTRPRIAGTSKLRSPGAKNPAKLYFCADCPLWLDFSGLGSMFRATFGKFGPSNA